MIVQHSFKKSYADELKYRVQKTNDIISAYSNEKFPIDTNNIVLYPGIEQPIGLIDKLVPTSDGDFQSAVALYEAYSFVIRHTNPTYTGNQKQLLSYSYSSRK